MIRIPLLKDNHNHLFTYSALNKSISLFNINKKQNALKLLSALPYDKLNIITGWFDSYYNFTVKELNDLPPVIIIHNSLHKYLFNEEAALKISENYEDWVKHNNDQIWVEKNIMKILSYISGITRFEENILKKTIDKNLEAGVCFTSDMFVNNIEIFKYLSNIQFDEFTEIWTDPDLYPGLPEIYRKTCKGIKIFTDGALGSSSAAISEYKGNWQPVLTYAQKELDEVLEKYLSYNINISIHCIGDIAIGQTINSITKIRKKYTSPIIRLEHTQFINIKQAKQAKDLGLILSMQPNFNMDSIVYNDRLTQKYCETNNPFRMLIDKAGFIPGKDLIFGSDGMPTGVEGTLQQSLFPPAPGQKISIDEFVDAYCTDSVDKGYINLEIDMLKKKIATSIHLNQSL